jgi:hypothetical protein
MDNYLLALRFPFLSPTSVPFSSCFGRPHRREMSNLRQRSAPGKSQLPVGEVSVKSAAGTSSLSRTKVLVGAVVVFSAIAFLPRRDSGKLPSSYALCSRSGKGIYTVDANNSQQQCLVVHEEHFVDTGNLSEISPHSFWPPTLTLPTLDDVLERWNVKGSEKLPVRYIDNGSIVIPGISGSFYGLHGGCNMLADSST